MANKNVELFAWHKKLCHREVVEAIEQHPGYENMQYLIANKNQTGDLSGLTDAIMRLSDLCESVAIGKYIEWREQRIVRYSIASAICSIFYLVGRLAEISSGYYNSITAASSILLFGVACWIKYRTPYVMCKIDREYPIRKAQMMTVYFQEMGYDVVIEPIDNSQ